MKRSGAVLVAPAVILFAVMVAAPLVYSLALSVYQYNINEIRFIGLQNFINLFKDPAFIRALKNTGLYVAVIVPGVQVVSILSALAAFRAGRLKSSVRTALYMSARTAGIAMMGAWAWIWYPFKAGWMNAVIKPFGGPINWAARPTTAILIVCLTGIAWAVGSYFIIYLAALDGQPIEIHDAARVDGASEWQEFWLITLPLLRRVALYSTIIAIIGTAQIWEIILLFTGGGPSGKSASVGYYLYQKAYGSGEYGLASAIGVVMLVIIIIMVWGQNRLLRER